jgi:filamentous hemagglutinin family protein
MSRNISGPWQFKGILNEIAGNSNTNHQAIIDFKGKTYFINHNGALAANAGDFTSPSVSITFTIIEMVL